MSGVKNTLLLLDPAITMLAVVNVAETYLTSSELPFNPIGYLVVVHCPLA